jgi:pyruvate kinase
MTAANHGEPLGGIKTKIVATVGPASETHERLTSLVQAGVDVFRLNMAHGRREWHEAVLARIRDVSTRLGRPIAVLADLGGPKIRLGPVAGGAIQCEPDQRFRFVKGATSSESASDLTSTYTPLVDELKVGDMVLLSDGTVSLEVEQKSTSVAVCRVVQPGEIRTGGGINLPGVELQVGALTDKDLSDVEWGARAGVDFFGLSFVRRATDVSRLRDELARRNCTAQIVAKIEKPQAVAAIDEIIRETDAVMVARGDLGVEIDVARVAAVQKQVIAKCHEARVPVITATQMLESMKSSRLPTRAEATDVANAILDGSDALMLSAETAVGQYPVEAVAMMNRIARETEPMLPPRFGRPIAPAGSAIEMSLTESIVEATSRLADQLALKLVVVGTRSGNTALVLAKQRGRTPIAGISDDPRTVRRMCLYWGVTPSTAPQFRTTAELVRHVTDWGCGLLKPGDRIAVIASGQWTAAGHNMVLIHEVE